MIIKAKFFVARIVLILATGVMTMLTRKGRYRWLLRYLVGRGGNQNVPFGYVLQNAGMFERVSSNCDGKFCVNNTTLYEGVGFGHRPELFYMIGCFTFDYERINSEYVRVKFEDVYDWHPGEVLDEGEEYQEEYWYTTPLPAPLARIGRLIFGDFYFPKYGWPMQQEGVSNAFFADLESVGARPFTSRFSGILEIPAW